MRKRVRARECGIILGLFCLPQFTGCGLVSQRRLDDSRVRIQALQTENEQLRDVVLNVRSQNKEMAARALDENRRVRALEEANQRLERSILAYQDEAKQTAALLDSLKAQVRIAATASDSRLMLREGVREFLAGEPELRFDEARLTVSLPADRVFEADTSRLTPEAERWLDGLGGVVRKAGGEPHTRLRITGDVADHGSSVRRVALDAGEADAQASWKLQKLATRLRSAARLPEEAVVAVAGDAQAGGDQIQTATQAAWVEIRFLAEDSGKP